MKRLSVILLATVLALFCFSCASEPDEGWCGGCHVFMRHDTMIWDENGVNHCLWEDGSERFDDSRGTGRQEQKSAELEIGKDYELAVGRFQSVGYGKVEFFAFDFEYFCPLEFECDESKFEITANPEKDNYFNLKVLQPCYKEKIIIKLTSKSRLDYIPPHTENITITIDAAD